MGYGCEECRKDIDRLFDGSAADDTDRTLALIAATKHIRRDATLDMPDLVSCRSCHDYYEKQKTRFTGS
jgi:cytochrome c peroxidase